MNLRRSYFLGFILFTCGLFHCQGGAEQSTNRKIRVFAAASTAEVLEEIIDSFTLKTHIAVSLNVASSGTLARQIAQGAAADVFLTADPKWLRYLDSVGYLNQAAAVDVAKNALVLVQPTDAPAYPFPAGQRLASFPSLDSLLSLASTQRLAIGDPTHVPLGRYTVQALRNRGQYTAIQDRLLLAKDARAVLRLVELGETALGIIYRTDAGRSKRVHILADCPMAYHDPIIYKAAPTQPSLAKEFLAYLTTQDVKSIWAKYHFEPID
ncbi:MAG: molybdate ABC transporter substrate-binding protein [Bacteroidota bacterium]